MGICVLHVSAAVYAHNVEVFSIEGGRGSAGKALLESQGNMSSHYENLLAPVPSAADLIFPISARTSISTPV